MLKYSDLSQIQIEGLAHLHVNPFCGLFFDAGLGKTVTGLTYLKQRLNLGISHKALVVAPIRVAIQTWRMQLQYKKA